MGKEAELKTLLEHRSQTVQSLSPLNIPEHLDAKTTKKLLALHRRELKDLREARQLELAKEIGLGSLAAIIYSGGQIAKAALEGVLEIEANIAGNPNPVSQGISIAAQALAIAGFATTPFGQWILRNLGFKTPGARNDATGDFCLRLVINGVSAGPGGVHCYTTAAERDQAVNFFQATQIPAEADDNVFSITGIDVHGVPTTIETDLTRAQAKSELARIIAERPGYWRDLKIVVSG